WFYEMAETASSPHTRRYFLHGCFPRFSYGLFSAHAEVFPSPHVRSRSGVPLLRTRGGISGHKETTLARPISSPHTRRYFRAGSPLRVEAELFSAHAEVFPRPGTSWAIERALLRTRGGISESARVELDMWNASPHTRRYFQR